MSYLKYELVSDDTIQVLGVTLTRVRSLADGGLGGYVQGEHNLSQYGNAWVSGNATVYGNAKVYGNANVSGNAEVYGNVEVYGNAKVFENAEVYGNVKVFENAEVYGNATVSGDAEVYGNASVSGNASRNPLVLTGLYWPVTITDEHMRIGCQFHTLDAWARFDEEAIQDMAPDALEFYRTYVPGLLHLAASRAAKYTKYL